MKFLPNNRIRLDRELSDLDLFTMDFVKVLRKHTKYVIVSGYVSILLGRARVSEDVDIIIPKMGLPAFRELLNGLYGNNFHCLNAEQDETIYAHMKDGLAARFAKKDTAIPNIELKFAKNKFDDIALAKTITVEAAGEEMIISHLELQIAFKETVLKSSKDMEDAKHVRNIAEGHLDKDLIRRYGVMLRGF